MYLDDEKGDDEERGGGIAGRSDFYGHGCDLRKVWGSILQVLSGEDSSVRSQSHLFSITTPLLTRSHCASH